MRNILVTGAFGGMGRSVLNKLFENGDRVYALDLSVPESVPENVLSVRTDVSSEESVKRAFVAVRKETDHLDAVIHLAGIYLLDSLLEISGEDIEKVFQINLLGACRINRIFSPLLGPGSRIVTVTSELATGDPLPFTGLYAISKAALDKYSFSLAMEAQLLGIRVSVLRAGAVDTGLLDTSQNELSRFTKETKLYSVNASRFTRIVGNVEARKVSPDRVADEILKILRSPRPRFAYRLNRNPLLALYDHLPSRFQLFVIRMILKPKSA